MLIVRYNIQQQGFKFQERRSFTAVPPERLYQYIHGTLSPSFLPTSQLLSGRRPTYTAPRANILIPLNTALKKATRKEMKHAIVAEKESDFIAKENPWITWCDSRAADAYHVAFLFTLGNKSLDKAKRFSPSLEAR